MWIIYWFIKLDPYPIKHSIYVDTISGESLQYKQLSYYDKNNNILTNTCGSTSPYGLERAFNRRISSLGMWSNSLLMSRSAAAFCEAQASILLLGNSL